MRSSIAIVVATAALLAAAGCGDSSSETPPACLEGPAAYLEALEGVPQVKLKGNTRISDCLPENQSGGDLETVGKAMVAAATRLSAEARKDPGGQANVQLGYLLGAAALGAEKANGADEALVRRLSAAANYAHGDQKLPLAYVRALAQGAVAGKEGG